MVKVSDCQIPSKANRSDGVLSKWLLLRHIQSFGTISIGEPISIVVAKPFLVLEVSHPSIHLARQHQNSAMMSRQDKPDLTSMLPATISLVFLAHFRLNFQKWEVA